MKSYALFLGCTIPARQPNYELSARKALKALGVDLVDLDGFGCCAPPPIESIALDSSLAVSAYNICLAEEAELNLITLCSGCFQSLARTNALLKRDRELKDEVNAVLSKVGKEFKGKIEVTHYLFDDPEKPKILDELIEALGAKSVDYMDKLKCCGGLLRGYDDDLALELSRDKIVKASKAGADCIITVCPFCFINLDMGQIQIARKYKETIARKYKETHSIPILHYSELLSLALGIEAKELSPQSHRVKIDGLLEKIG